MYKFEMYKFEMLIESLKKKKFVEKKDSINCDNPEIQKYRNTEVKK